MHKSSVGSRKDTSVKNSLSNYGCININILIQMTFAWKGTESWETLVVQQFSLSLWRKFSKILLPHWRMCYISLNCGLLGHDLCCENLKSHMVYQFFISTFWNSKSQYVYEILQTQPYKNGKNSLKRHFHVSSTHWISGCSEQWIKLVLITATEIILQPSNL